VADLNFIVLTGRSTKDAVVRPKASGQAKAEFSFEVDRPFLRESGEPVSDLFLVDVWGELASWAVEHVKAGTRLAVIGTLNKESYMTRGGREHLTVIKAKGMKLLDGKDWQYNLEDERIKGDSWDQKTIEDAVRAVQELVTY